jgi:predicted ATPase/class 3 adenylate cyclase
MSSLPTGTVTFLFTDIEGSTRLLQDLGDTVSEQVFADHRRLLIEAAESAGGTVYQDQGESFVLAFHRAKDAVLAAVAVQRVLANHSWPGGIALRVRMGLHTGEPANTRGEYVGVDVHRAARICSVGYGGQILLSDATRAVVESNLSDGVILRDLGEHRLKDLVRPHRLFQIVAQDLPADFPPLKSLDALPNNLPMQLSSFIGREEEIAEIKRLLSMTRLVTLIGMGGAGKTRLSLQVAAEVLEEFKDGAWVVELASLSDPAHVPKAVASAMNVSEQPGRPLSETLLDYLRAKSLLLVLDNCEHVLAACAHIAETLLRGCPQMRILVTSREALVVEGETTYGVPSLSLPAGPSLPVERLTEFEAVRLFIDRATAALPSFALTGQNARAVATICQQLDGIPLAIELAAPKVKSLSVEHIAERLHDRFGLLTSGRRTALPRQQTLRATMDWSYDLLSEPERVLLRRLSVFAGGFTLEAAEAVCQGPGVKAAEVVDLLTRLVEKSLVMFQGQQGRYGLLETVRQYGHEKLLESREEAATRGRHLDWYLGMAERSETEDYDLRVSPIVEVSQQLDTENDNLRAALAWSLEENAEAGLRLTHALRLFWSRKGHYGEARAWLAKVLERTGAAPPILRARAFRDAGFWAWVQGAFREAAALGEEGLRLSEQVEDKGGIADSLILLGLAEMAVGSYDRAAQVLDEGLILYRDVGNKKAIADTVRQRGFLATRQGDYSLAATFLEEAVSLHKEVGPRAGVAFSLRHLGVIRHYQRDYTGAIETLEQSLALFRELKQVEGIPHALTALGSALRHIGNHARALVLYKESLAISREHGIKWAIFECLFGLAGISASQEQRIRAARLLGAAEALREAMDYSLPLPDQAEYEGLLALVQASLGGQAFSTARTEGRAMTLEQAIEYALRDDGGKAEP